MYLRNSKRKAALFIVNLFRTKPGSQNVCLMLFQDQCGVQKCLAHVQTKLGSKNVCLMLFDDPTGVFQCVSYIIFEPIQGFSMCALCYFRTKMGSSNVFSINIRFRYVYYLYTHILPAILDNNLIQVSDTCRKNQYNVCPTFPKNQIAQTRSQPVNIKL